MCNRKIEGDNFRQWAGVKGVIVMRRKQLTRCDVLVVGLVSLTTMLSAPSRAASFDCAKASSVVEKLICRDPDMSQLDDRLSEAYSAAREQSGNPSQLASEQRAWMARRNQCQTAACVSGAYSARLTELDAGPKGPPTPAALANRDENASAPPAIGRAPSGQVGTPVAAPSTNLGSLGDLIKSVKGNLARSLILYGEGTAGFHLSAALDSVEVIRNDTGGQVAQLKLGDSLRQFAGTTIVWPDPTAEFYCLSPLREAADLESNRMIQVHGILIGADKTQQYNPAWKMNQDHYQIAATCSVDR